MILEIDSDKSILININEADALGFRTQSQAGKDCTSILRFGKIFLGLTKQILCIILAAFSIQWVFPPHMSLMQNLTIKSHKQGKKGHFQSCEILKIKIENSKWMVYRTFS